MLRRPATTLTITAEDVAAYEDRRAREALAAAQQARLAEQQQQQQQAGMEGVHHDARREAEAQARRARDERIGVTRRGGTRS